MASLFRARRRRSPEEEGDGGEGGNGRSVSGKVSRRRLAPDEDAPSPAAEAEGRSPGWLSGLISGAGRVISSVFFSSPEEGETSSEEDDNDDDDLSFHENEDVDEAHKVIISYSESKLAIEQLVMKETFSRDECDRMIKLIQARVTESPSAEVLEYGTPKEFPSRTTGGAHDFTGAWRSLNHNRNFLESVPFSSSRLGRFSPGSPLQASPELCNAAVMEAKKWLEEKRQGSSSKPEDHGPCTLNTDMFNSGFESDISSPIDLAKSYMQSLPPWQSPLGCPKFKTPPSVGIDIYKDEITRGKSDYSMSSSKVMKQDYLSTFWDNLEESRRGRLGSSSGSLDISKFGQFGSTAKLFENDTSVVSLGTHEKGGEPLANNQGSEEAAAAIQPTNGSSLLNAGPPEPTPAKTLSADQSTGPDAPTKDGNDVVVKSWEPVKQDNGNDLIHERLAASKEHPGDGLHGADDVAQENLISPTSVTKDAANHNGINVQAATAEPEVHSESHLNLDSELRPKDAGPQIQSSMNVSTNKTSTNGFRDRSNANSGLESSGNDNPSCTNSSSAVPLTDNEILSESAADATGKSSVENGATMKPTEQIVGAPRPTNVRRGRKRVVRGTRGRGRAK